MELIERNVKIFSLKNLRLLKRLREENGVEKSDEADAKLLSIIPRNHFRPLTLKELKLLQLINIYEKYARWKKTVQQWANACPQNPLKECVKRLRSLRDHYGYRIIKEVMKNKDYATIYRMTCEELELRDSVEVAILVARLPLNWKLSRLKGLLGLTPHKNKNKNNYNHKLRTHLTRLAATIYVNNKRYGTGVKLFENISCGPQNKVLYALQLRILKILKKAWQQQQKQRMLAGGQ